MSDQTQTPKMSLKERNAKLLTIWHDVSEKKASYFDNKPRLKQQFVECVQLLSIINPEILRKYPPEKLAAPLLKAAEMGMLPDGNECAIVEVGDKPACWLMTNGARKRIAEMVGVKHLIVECVYDHEIVVYNKLSNIAPVIHLKDGHGFFSRGKLVGAIAFVEMHDGRIILEQLGVEDAKRYKPKKKTWHYSDDWMEAFLQNIVTKMLYKKLPKRFNEPQDSWDDTDIAGDSGGSALEYDTTASLVSEETAVEATATPADEPADESPPADEAVAAAPPDEAADAGDGDGNEKEPLRNI